MFVFIVRPFGAKKSAKGVEVDYDEVDRKLIQPALAKLKEVQGQTAAAVLEAGNIRTDMFRQLVTADLVLADVSIHNANVFYELGIRHALRKGRTFLVRHEGDDIPFDLKTDRYLSYDAKDPGASVEKLVAGLRATIDGRRVDSPIFLLLPDLGEPDVTSLVEVPPEFTESVILATKEKRKGDLALLGEECRSLSWERGALRLVGEAQFRLKAYEGARATWEAVKRGSPQDVLANQRLATIYQKLGQIDLSDLAIQRVFDSPHVSPKDLAETHALAGSNAKRRWLQSWSGADAAVRAKRALESPLLPQARQHYEDGFKENLDQFYPGLNAFAMASVEHALAGLLPKEWAARFESKDDAPRELQRLHARCDRLAAAVETSFEGAERRDKDDRWLAISRADFAVLRGQEAARVEYLYRSALRKAESFDFDAIDAQLAIFRDLGLFKDAVEAAAAVVKEIRASAGHAGGPAQAPPRVLLFTGHRMDAPGRKMPRFPAAAEAQAKAMIRDVVQAEVTTAEGAVRGLAGGASGGDILFHEVCAELNVPTTVFLAGPRDAYVVASVQDSVNGSDWVRRLDRLLESRPARQLGDALDVPSWHPGRGQKDAVWPRNNHWMLHNALADGAAHVTLVALWNGQGGDGPGGTEDMIRRARERGARIVILDAKKLVGVEP